MTGVQTCALPIFSAFLLPVPRPWTTVPPRAPAERAASMTWSVAPWLAMTRMSSYTYAYDTERLKDQKEREQKAAQRIFNLLPEDQAKEMFDLFEEFEAGATPEARYAKALDNIQPIMLNDASDGRDWREKGIRISQAIDRQRRTAEGSEVLWENYSKPLLQKNIDEGNIKGDISLDEIK